MCPNRRMCAPGSVTRAVSKENSDSRMQRVGALQQLLVDPLTQFMVPVDRHGEDGSDD